MLLDKCPAAIRHADNNGDLPIHLASGFGARSPEFCRLLIEAYPRSERTTNAGGYLPLHCACAYGTAATVKYLISLHPAGINAPVYNGFYPIHFAISGLMNRKDDPETASKMVEVLVTCDPCVASQEFNGKLPLVLACIKIKEMNLDVGLKIIKLLYDIYPESILGQESFLRDIIRSHSVKELQEFLSTQLACADQTKDRDFMSTPDESG